jgi:hypothetical protein
MKRISGVFLIVGAALVLGALSAAAPAAAQEKGSGPSDRGGCEVLEAGNDFYRVFVNDEDCADESGLYTALTGPEHPVGPRRDLLYSENPADPFPYSSFDTVRSYTTGTDYSRTGGFDLGPFVDIVPIGATGFEVVYDLRGSDAPDDIVIIQRINVNGTTLADSSIEVTTTVQNHTEINGLERGQPAGTIGIGIRYMWDFRIGNDDGPTFQPINPDGPAYTHEEEFAPLAFESYRMADNDLNPISPSYYVFGTVSGPVSITPAPTPPDRLQYAHWGDIEATAFDYTPSDQIIALQGFLNDSAVAYYWGPDAKSAIIIPPDEEYTVSQSLFARGANDLCFSLELDATQTSNNLGIPGLQNNDVVCGDGVLLGAQPGEEEVVSRGAPEKALFELFFDGSDVGITRTIIDGMDVLEEFSTNGDFARGNGEHPLDVLLSFNQAHSIPPVGLVLQSDIVRFVADANGPNTAGSFERFLDGSDIGLAAAGEDIDAFVFRPYSITAGRGTGQTGDLFFSTRGNGNGGGISWQDEDIIACLGYSVTPGQGGDINSSCTEFFVAFDGTAAGLNAASEDIDAFALTFTFVPDEEPMAGRGSGFIVPVLYLSTRGNFEISAVEPASRGVQSVSGRNEDVFLCVAAIPQALLRGGTVSGCSSVALAFDGSTYGLGSNNVYSIDLLRPDPVPIAKPPLP